MLAALTGSSACSGESKQSGDEFTGGVTFTTDATEGEGTSGEATSTGSSSGPVLDVGMATGEEGTTGGEVPLTCETIDMLDDTSVGCEFWSTNWITRAGYGMAIGVGNPTEESATVTIERMGMTGLETLTTVTLPPQGSQLIQIDGPGGVLGGEVVQVQVGMNDLAALHVVSDVPITAMQVSPAGGGATHVSEASLLLPQNSLRDTYFAIGYEPYSANGGRVAVVGTVDGTQITTTAGAATLDRFDVQLYQVNDATGFFVHGDQPVAVFSGGDITNVPYGTGAADHLQEQVVPAASWGTHYVGGRHPVRMTASNSQPEPVYWRVLAGEDNTVINLTPPVAGASISIAGAGEFVEFTTAESFVAESDKPFLLVQYMSGCINVVPSPLNPSNPCNEPATGDPYMIQIPPVEQWLDSLPFLTDSSYPRDFVAIFREAGTSVSLACMGEIPASYFTAIPGTNYEVGTVDLDVSAGQGSCADGAHFLTASAPVGVIVGGMDWATSYGYAGGLAFQDLWTPPFDPPG